MKLFKDKQIQPQSHKCPEPPKDDSITTLEIYARDRLKHEMYILNNFLESLYKEPEYSFDRTYKRDNRWVKICNNHIDCVKDVVNSNYGDGVTKKCKYCNTVFNGYMAGAKLEYHNNTMHKEQLEKEYTANIVCAGLVMGVILNSITKSLPNTNPNASDKG